MKRHDELKVGDVVTDGDVRGTVTRVEIELRPNGPGFIRVPHYFVEWQIREPEPVEESPR